MFRYLPLLLLVGACTPSTDQPYPDGFVWGVSTAGFQDEMGCPTWPDSECLDTNSDWYQWVTTPSILQDPNLVVTGEDVRDGPGMWETFEDDVRQMKRDGITGFRMSLEWSRLFPDPASLDATTVDELATYADPKAVQRYHEWFAALRAAGIHPLVTIDHYTLPVYVSDGVACHEDLDTCTARGWVGAAIIPKIALYAGYVAKEFGGDVDQWATLNEPFALTLSGYLAPGELRSSPPGIVNAAAAVATIQHQIEGSAAMYDAVKANDTVDADGDGVAASVGIVMNMVDLEPADPNNPKDVTAVEHADWLYHRLFLDGLTNGSWDANLDGTWDETRSDLAGRLDWIGINYYNQVTVQGTGIQPFPNDIPLLDFIPNVTFDSYPPGIKPVVDEAASYGLPITITENGTPDVAHSATILTEHLKYLQQAVAGGDDVRGYYYWTWVDNYEWSHGTDMKLGLNQLNINTKERIPRPVLQVYEKAIRANGPAAN